jgi:hypothetical protein
MLYIPKDFEVSQAEQSVLKAYLSGDFTLCGNILDSMDVESSKIVYLMRLVRSCVDDEESHIRSSGNRVAIAGASHCISPAWSNLTIGERRFTVKPYYYMEMSISSFLSDRIQLRRMFSDILEKRVIITAGGLDVYSPGGKFIDAGAGIITKYCDDFAQFLKEYSHRMDIFVLPLLPSKGSDEKTRITVNNCLRATCRKHEIKLLEVPYVTELQSIDSRHFRYNYLQEAFNRSGVK